MYRFYLTVVLIATSPVVGAEEKSVEECVLTMRKSVELDSATYAACHSKYPDMGLSSIYSEWEARHLLKRIVVEKYSNALFSSSEYRPGLSYEDVTWEFCQEKVKQWRNLEADPF